MSKEEAIYRLNALSMMCEYKDAYGDYVDTEPYDTAVEMAVEALEERRTGKWIGGELGYCSVCGHEGCASDIWDRCKGMFCPNYGAKLEE